MTKYRAISYGLGPIGCLIAKVALERKNQIDLIGAVDINPEIVGKDLSKVIGTTEELGIRVTDSAGDLYKSADVVLHATGSFLITSLGQFKEFCENGVDVVTTNEELSYPWYSHPKEAQYLHSLAIEHEVTILATGVNPGFAIDSLAVVLSGACASVREIRATRILDATKRRVPFQKKVGIGLEVDEFEQNVRTGKFGHIGLPESIALVCEALGRSVDKVEQKIVPKIADREIETEHFGIVKKGRVIGLVQDGEGYADGRKLAIYHIEMYAGAEETYDEISIVGEPNISLRIPGGTPGDIATAAIIVNSVPRVVESKPGLMTVKDLRPASGVFV